MHIADLGLNILGANGIVGAAMPLSTGAGLAARLDGSGRVAVAFFGDGASNQGVFHESLNLASVWKLPIVFICENNQYALSTSYRDTTSVDQVAERASAYGIPGRTIDGNDVVEVYEAVREAVERARAGEGPALIEAMTYRWGGHSMRANIRDPRSGEEYASWMERDPLQRAERELRDVEIVDEAGIESIGAQTVSELDEAVEFGRAAAQPEADVLRAAVYAPHEAFDEPGLANGNGRAIGFVDALNEALHQEMESDPARRRHGRGRRRDRRHLRCDQGAFSRSMERTGCGTPRSPRPASSAAGSGPRSRGSGPWSRSRSSTSSPSPWTCWSTRPQSSGSCWGGRTPCRW